MIFKEFMYFLIQHMLKGFILVIVYFELTKAQDTTFENTLFFTLFYISMVIGASLTGIDPNVVTSAFLTKAVFTLVDERIKRKNKNS